MRIRIELWAALAAAALAVATPVRAQEIVSRTTRLDAKGCRTVSEAEESLVRRCRGFAGIEVYAVEGDARSTLSYGPAAERQPASKAFFAPLNSNADTIEWRAVRSGPDLKPFATIVRWSGRDPVTGRRHAMLVVTRLPPGRVCHVAYIDLAANPDAAAIARRAADTLAREADCSRPPRILGKPGPGTRLLKPYG